MDEKTLLLFKKVWGDDPLTISAFEQKTKDIKLVDLSTGNYIDKHKLVDLENEHKETINSLEAANKSTLKELDKIQKSKLDPEAVTKQMEELKNNYETQIKDIEKKSSDLQKSNLIKEAIVKAGGNPDIILPLIIGRNDIEKINLDNNNLVGITDILTAYKTDASTAGLFVKPENIGTDSTATSTKPPVDTNSEFEKEQKELEKSWGLDK